MTGIRSGSLLKRKKKKKWTKRWFNTNWYSLCLASSIDDFIFPSIDRHIHKMYINSRALNWRTDVFPLLNTDSSISTRNKSWKRCVPPHNIFRRKIELSSQRKIVSRGHENFLEICRSANWTRPLHRRIKHSRNTTNNPQPPSNMISLTVRTRCRGAQSKGRIEHAVLHFWRRWK